MPKVTDEHRATRRLEIVDAAIRVFRRNGYSRTSMADIITESGLSAGAIYGYFESKQSIVHAVGDRIFGQRATEIEALRADHVPSPGEVMETMLRGIHREPFEAVVVQLWAEAAADPYLRGVLQSVFTRIIGTLTQATLAWGAAHPELVPEDLDAWAGRVATVYASMGPGFMLFSTMLDDFDAEGHLDAISVALGIAPNTR